MLGSRVKGRKQGWPLYIHLMLFGLALTLPVLVFAGLILTQYDTLDRLHFNERIIDTAEEVADELDQKLAGAISTAKALSTSPALTEGNLEVFYHQAVAALAPSDGAVVLVNQFGEPLVSTRVPWGTPLVTNPEIGQDSSVEPYISDLYISRRTGAPTFAVSVPFLTNSGTLRTLRLSFPPGYVADIVHHYKAPAGWRVMIADGRNRVIVGSSDHATPLGSVLPDPIIGKSKLPRGAGTATDVDGERISFGCSRPKHARWLTCALVPTSIAEAPLARGWWILTSSGTCLLALSLLGAIGLGRGLGAPIRRVALQAGELESGRTVTPLSTWVREANEVSSALSAAASQISQRTREIAASRAELTLINSELETRVIAQTQELRQEMRRREEMQSALVHVQKMEAIGRLVAGVAHDFNNILGVIITNQELLEPFACNGKSAQILRRVKDAAEMGARLTRRLLSVAHRQELSPRRVNLNDRIEGMTDLLNRSLGVSVSLVVDLAKDLWMTRADPSEIENAVLNLAVNSRDAMPQGGRLTIATGNVTVDETMAASEPGLQAGAYVVLTVSDTGSGMTREVLERAFEPFFTTKPPGKGTGLGLATIYGFARQSHGNVAIWSDRGKGTTVKIYLPRDRDGEADRKETDSARAPRRGGGETILVVEDNPAMQDASVRRLESLGYTTIVANSGTAAIEILTSHGHIDLVFSDVVMPGGISGHDLARWIKENRPDIGVLLTSGFQGELTPSTNPDGGGEKVLAKPFTGHALAHAIDDALDHPRPYRHPPAAYEQ
jgi:signal transduction histidine kinase/ActR/RegA family two-component response regulator